MRSRISTLLFTVLLLSAGAAHSITKPPPAGVGLDKGLRQKIARGLDVAILHLDHHPSCRQLFFDLNADGADLLARTVYTPANAREEARYCPGVSAFTSVGSRITRVCRNFRRLPTHHTAVVLIHEALHQAGMSERPLERTALDSAEINELVRTTCHM